MNELSKTMTAIRISEPGGPDVLQSSVRPVPHPSHGEVLIKVKAAGLNGADLSQRRGRYGGGKAPEVLGLEVAGTITKVGSGVTEWREGDTVCALLNNGGYAEYAIAPAAQCLPIPRGMDLVNAAGLPEACVTVWLNVFELGGLKPGERLLVHGGASGIGSIAIQLARALGAQVYATAGSPEKCARCVELGAHLAINYKTEDFVEVVKRETAGAGVDVILEMVGGDYLPRGLDALASGGRQVIIAMRKGSKVEFDFAQVQAKGAILTGSRLGPRSPCEKARLVAIVRRAVWPLIEEGRVKPIIDRVFPLSEAANSHAYMETGKHVGKILLACE
jgi:putative PIG3 family NAD(P)H quinone oxidoreductase